MTIVEKGPKLFAEGVGPIGLEGERCQPVLSAYQEWRDVEGMVAVRRDVKRYIESGKLRAQTRCSR